MPASETLWNAATAHEWNQATSAVQQQTQQSAEEIFQTLFDPSRAAPSKIGPFGCHVVILHILQKVFFLSRSFPGFYSRNSECRQHFFQALKRWQTMWESEPDASMFPDEPSNPILFNCTAICRLTYVRLAADFCDVRRSFSYFLSEDQIVANIESAHAPLRTQQITEAALQACQALHVPAQLGFRLVSRTRFWGWSVQHALSYFECALLLSKWLQVIERVGDISQDEMNVVDTVQRMLHASSSQIVSKHSQYPNSVTILHRLAELIDTGETTVWNIVPKMARVLRAYAEKLSDSMDEG